MNKLVYVVADGFSEYNSSHFRATLFCDQIASHNDWDVHIISIENWLKDDARCSRTCSNADIIVIQRVLISESLKTALKYKSMGARVYVDFDDAYQMIGEENAAYKFWGEGKINMASPLPRYKIDSSIPDPVEQFRQSLGLIDGGITPSRTLSNDWASYGTMYTLHNYLDWHRYQAHYVPRRKSPKDVLIGWGGSMSHLTSFSGSGVIQALQKATQETIAKFLLVGDNRVAPMLGLTANNLLFSPYVMWMDWLRVLNRFDIGIAPLSHQYDCRRSRLKVMEYIALGIPFVATKSVVYEDFFDCDSGVFVEQGVLDVCDVPNTAEWYKAISLLVNNYDEWAERAKQTRQDYKEMIAIERQDLDSFYKELL